jgi:CRISPR/Cas system-associated exonuclease Cas4 (RecB family)
MYVSQSSLRAYNSCPAKMHFKLNKYPRQVSASMITGTLVHDMIDKFEEGDSNAHQDCKQLLENRLRDDKVIFRKWRTKKSFLKLVDMCYYNYLEMRDKFPPVRGGEIKFSVEYKDGVEIKGIWDQLRAEDNILEFKTSKRTPSDVYLNADIQSLVYTWAYNKVYNHMPNYHYVHLATGKVYLVKKFDFSVLYAMLDDFIEDFKQGHWTKRRDAYKCQYCDYAQFCLETSSESELLFTSAGKIPKDTEKKSEFLQF